MVYGFSNLFLCSFPALLTSSPKRLKMKYSAVDRKLEIFKYGVKLIYVIIR